MSSEPGLAHADLPLQMCILQEWAVAGSLAMGVQYAEVVSAGVSYAQFYGVSENRDSNAWRICAGLILTVLRNHFLCGRWGKQVGLINDD